MKIEKARAMREQAKLLIDALDRQIEIAEEKGHDEIDLLDELDARAVASGEELQAVIAALKD